jgi:hypothetical protein
MDRADRWQSSTLPWLVMKGITENEAADRGLEFKPHGQPHAHWTREHIVRTTRSPCGVGLHRKLEQEPSDEAGPRDQGMKHVPDEIGRGLVPGIEDEDAVVHELGRRQPATFVLALDKAGQHVPDARRCSISQSESFAGSD